MIISTVRKLTLTAEQSAAIGLTESTGSLLLKSAAWIIGIVAGVRAALGAALPPNRLTSGSPPCLGGVPGTTDTVRP